MCSSRTEGRVLPLSGEQLFRRCGVGELLDGAVGHPELPLDRASDVSRRQQCVDGGMPAPGPIGESVPARPRRTGRVRGCNSLGLGLGFGCRGDRSAEAVTVLGDAPLGGLAQAVPEMPPVRDLDGLRRTGGGALGEERRPVPAHDLDAGPIGEPGRQAGCLPVGQQVDRTAGFYVDENGAVVAALAGGVLVDADHTRGHLRLGKGVDQAQDGAPADGDPEHGAQAGVGPARKGETDRGQRRAQPLGPLTMPTGQVGYLLDECAPCAPRVPTGEPAHPQPENNASSGARHISGEPQVGTMNPVRPDLARRASGTGRSAFRVEMHYRNAHVHRQHRDVRDRREQQLLQPEHDLFHGPELSSQPP